MSFNKKITSLLKGTFISTAIPILFTPIITRIYTPAALGEFTLYLSLILIFSLFFSLCYEQAIVKPKNNKGAYSLLIFCFTGPLLIGLLVFSLIAVCVFLLGGNLTFWSFSILGGVLTAWFNGLRYIFIRKEKHKVTSLSLISKALTLVFLQLLLVDVLHDYALLVSHIIAMIICLLVYMISIEHNEKVGLFYIKISHVFFYLKKYSLFPKYTLPSSLSSIAIQQSVILFIPIFFGMEELGLFALCARVCGMPLILIGGAVGQVYLGSAEHLKRNDIDFRALFFSVFKKLLLISFFIFPMLLVFVVFFFDIVFGVEFKQAKEIVYLMLPLYVFRFFSSSLSVSYIVFDKQKYLFLFNLISLLITVVCIYYFRLDFLNFIEIYSLAMAVMYLYQIFYIYRLHK